MDTNNIPMLLPYEPADFWKRMKELVHEEVTSIVKNKEAITSVHVNGLTEKPLFKVNELCNLFQVSKPTIYEWIKAGKLKPVKIRSRVFFLGSDVMQLMMPRNK